MNNRSDILKSLLKEHIKVINDIVDNSDITEVSFDIDDLNRIQLSFTPLTINVSDYKIDYSEINKPKDFKNNKDFLNNTTPPQPYSVTLTSNKDSLDD